MQLLDSPLSAPPSKPIWSTVFRCGSFCGLAFISGAQALYHLNIFSMNWSGALANVIVILVVCFFTAYFSIKRQRDLLDGGYIGAGKGALVSTLSIYAGFLILDIWNYLFINFLSPGYLTMLKEESRTIWLNQVTPEELDEMLASIDIMQNFLSIVKNSFLIESPLGVLGGIIAAFFMSRKYKD